MMNSSNPALLLDPLALANGDNASFSKVSRGRTLVKVHPLVLMSILDHHTRRHENASRVIGTLLGQRITTHGSGGTSTTVIQITNCFAVPHAEQGEEVAIGKDFNRQMLALHTRANRSDVVVGWYATALPPDADGADTSGDADGQGYRCIADTSSLIHEFYAGESTSGKPSEAGSVWDPIHLVVDTSLTFDALAIKAYQSTPVTIGDETFANMFHEIPVEVTSSESERICVSKMLEDSKEQSEKDVQKTKDLGSSEDGIGGLEQSMEMLLQLIETISGYVDGQVDSSGASSEDVVVGRKLYDALASVPRVRDEVLEKLFHNKLHDLLMLTYLSQVTKTQVRLAEKLNETLTLGAA
jgi:translation initiation factor 3 subunit F